MLAAESGTQLDPDAVTAFTRHYSASRAAELATAIGVAFERMGAWIGSAVGGGASSVAQILPAAGAVAAITLVPTLSLEHHAQARTPSAAVGLSASPSSSARAATTFAAGASSSASAAPATRVNNRPAATHRRHKHAASPAPHRRTPARPVKHPTSPTPTTGGGTPTTGGGTTARAASPRPELEPAGPQHRQRRVVRRQLLVGQQLLAR